MSEMPLTLPRVTVCAAHPFTTSYAKKYLDELLIRNGFDLSKGPSNLYFNAEYSTRTNVQKIEYILHTALTNVMYNMSPSERANLGYRIEDILVSCSVGPRSCAHVDFVSFFNLNYGQCFAFTNATNKFMIQGGRNNGMKLEFLLNYDAKSFNASLSNGYNLDFAHGLRIWIHDEHTDISFVESTFASPGIMTNIMIKKTSLRQLPPPYSDCHEPDDQYTQSKCLFRCYLNFLERSCNCTLELNSRFEVCLSMQRIFCHFTTYEMYLQNITADSKCTVKCTPFCERVYYGLSLSYLDYPSLDYLKILFGDPSIQAKIPDKSTLTPESLKKSLLAVNIYFEDFDYTQIEEIPNMTFVELVSSFGGLMGLFVG
jgi:hypothetical protein